MSRAVTVMGIRFFLLSVSLQVASHTASGRQLQQNEIDSTRLCQVFHFDEDGDVNATSRRFLYPPCPTMSLFANALSSGTTSCNNESYPENRGALIATHSLSRPTEPLILLIRYRDLLDLPSPTTGPQSYLMSQVAAPPQVPANFSAGPPPPPSGLTLAPRPLRDLRPLSSTLPARETLASEGANYHWFFRTLQDFQRWAPCSTRAAVSSSKISNNSSPALHNLRSPPLPAKGWKAVRTLYVREPGPPAIYVPFVAVLRKGVMLVVLVKGTQTRQEWMYGEWVCDS